MKTLPFSIGILLLFALGGCTSEKMSAPSKPVAKPKLKSVSFETRQHHISRTDKTVILKDSSGVKLLKVRSEKNAPVDTTIIAITDSLWERLELVATVNVPPKFSKKEIAKRSDVCRSTRSNSLTVLDSEGKRLFNYHWDCGIIQEYRDYIAKVRGMIIVMDPNEKR